MGSLITLLPILDKKSIPIVEAIIKPRVPGLAVACVNCKIKAQEAAIKRLLTVLDQLASSCMILTAVRVVDVVSVVEVELSGNMYNI